MPREVNEESRATAPVRRAYNSPRRLAQAEATRAAMLEAAGRLFAAQGYATTTMDAVASDAGVALKTVYTAFATKRGLLRACWDLALKGDTDDTGVAQREWYRAVLEEPDAEQQLRLNARNARVVKTRIAPLLEVIRNAAPLDDDLAELYALIESDFYENQKVIVASLSAKHALRPDLDVARGTDLLWTLNHPDVWRALVTVCGWTPDAWEQWFADTACAQLLRAPESCTAGA
jgi:AcrR family transcriptional regulator